MRLKLLSLLLSFLFFPGAGGCQSSSRISSRGLSNPLKAEEFNSEPRTRIGSVPNPTLWTRFPDPENLGRHGYRFNLSEKNGIVYTLKAGHIDLAHLRNSADWSGFLAAKTYRNLMKNETGISFKLSEPSRYFVTISYPDDWQDISPERKETIAQEVSIRLSQYCVYAIGVWHEILTWFGYKAFGFYSEQPSAFSWEDTVSNLLGLQIAAQALTDTELPYEQALTRALNQKLEALEVQSSQAAESSAGNVSGLRFSDDLFIMDGTKSKNFDIGLDDGFITPWIVSSNSRGNETESLCCPVPDLDLSEYAFTVRFQIEPREWEKNRILKIIYPKAKQANIRLEPAVHFPEIMNYIVREAAQKYHADPERLKTVKQRTRAVR
jgi:hypothetical protein